MRWHPVGLIKRPFRETVGAVVGDWQRIATVDRSGDANFVLVADEPICYIQMLVEAE